MPAAGQDDIVVDFPRRQLSVPRPPWWSLATAATLAIALLLPLAAGGGPRSDTLIQFSSSSADAFGPAVASLPGGAIVVVWQGPASPPLVTTSTTATTATTIPPLLGSKPAQTQETTTSTEATTTTTEPATTTTTEAPTTSSTDATTTTTEPATTTTTEAPTTTTTTRPSLPGEGIFARIGPAGGGTLGDPIPVSDWGTHPAVAADSAGNFLVAWEQDGDVYTRLFDAHGNLVRDTLRLNLSTAGLQAEPAVSAVPNPLTSQFAVVFSGAGVEDTEGLPGVSRSANKTDDAGIWLRYTGANGNEPTQTLVNAASTAGTQGHPSVIATGINAVTVVWDGAGPDDSDGVFGARNVREAVIGPSGTSTSNATPPATVTHLSPVAGSQSNPKVALVGQTPVVVWSGTGPDDPAGIWAVPFDGSGHTPVLVNGYTDGDQLHPAVSGTSGNIVTVAWDGPGSDDNAGVWARRWDITANGGAPLSPQFRVNTPAGGTQADPAVTPTASGQYTVVFDRSSGGSDRAVYARPYNVNDPPVGVDDAYTVDEDTQLVVDSPDGQNGHLAGVLANDTDPDKDPLTATVTTPPQHLSTFDFHPDGTFTFQAAPNYNGVVTFDYRVSDARGAQALNPNRVTITVNSVDDGPPVPQPDVYPDPTPGLPEPVEDTQFTITDPKQGVLANDTDPDNDPLTAELAPNTNAGHGTVNLQSDGTFTYIPDHNFCGTGATQDRPPDSFQYMTSGGGKTSGPTTVTLKVTCVKDPPAANDDHYNAAEDTGLDVAAPGVLQNDFIDDGVQPKVTVTVQPEHGTVTLTEGPGPGTGHFIYQPKPNYNGPDSFSYKVIDTSEPSPTSTTTSSTTTTTAPLSAVTNLLGSTTTTTAPAPASASDAGPAGSVAQVFINVGAAEDAPVVSNDAYFVQEDTQLTVTAAEGVLANDADPDLGTLTAALASDVTNGKLDLKPDGSFTYMPDVSKHFHGQDFFTYTATNSEGKTSTARADIYVGPQKDKVVATGEKYVVDEDSSLTVNAPGVLANDFDPDGGPLKLTLVTGPPHGTLDLRTTGEFIYAPKPDFNGLDQFTYKITDQDGNEAQATATIIVKPTTEAQTAGDPTATAGPAAPLPPPPAPEVNPGPVAVKPPALPELPTVPDAAGGGCGSGGNGPTAKAAPPPPVILNTTPAKHDKGFPVAPLAAGLGGLGLLGAAGGILAHRRHALAPLENLPL